MSIRRIEDLGDETWLPGLLFEDCLSELLAGRADLEEGDEADEQDEDDAEDPEVGSIFFR